MRRVAGALLLLLAAAILGLFILADVVVRRPFPQTRGRIEIPGLKAPVEVLRDAYGVPHIYAGDEHDLFVAQGYVHAQDRFWQMEFWRHVGQGRLAEIVGAPGVDADRFIRTLGWNRIAAATVAMYAARYPRFFAILQAYSEGVNAYLAEHGNHVSLNQTILSRLGAPWEVEPWEPLDTVAWGVVMSWDLSMNMAFEQSRASLIRQLGPDRAAQLLPPYPRGRPVIVASDAGQARDTPVPLPPLDWERLDTGRPERVLAGLALGAGPGLGSNSWVVSGRHTGTGRPLLANDPHLSIQMPAVWYEAGLHAPGWEVAGLSFAGVPGVVIGRNDRIAWGFTNTGADVQDLYLEKLDPDDPDRVRFGDAWEAVRVVEEVIRVKGGQDVVLPVRLTRHGPIVNADARRRDPGLDPLALRWTATEPSTLLAAVLRLDQAGDFGAFRRALRLWDVAPQNAIYADVDGNIGYQMPGRIPVRARGDGSVPVPGWTGDHEWIGWIPYDDLPSAYNPEKGYIVTANNAIVDSGYPHLLTVDWSNGDRAARIVEMIDEILPRRPVTAADCARLQLDSESLLARTYLPLLRDLRSDDGSVQALLDRLRAWDGQERRRSVAAAVFEVFFLHLVGDVLGDEVEADGPPAVGYPFFHDLAGRPDSPWWDDVRTEARETRRDVLLASLRQTAAWFAERVGGDPRTWTWGAIHTATFVSKPLGSSGVRLLEAIVNRGPYPVDGGTSVVNASAWSRSNPAAVTSHPSMRLVIDLSDADGGRVVLPTGQSGHPFHPHYDDQIRLWVEGEYRPLRLRRQAVAAATVDRLTLDPSPGPQRP